jgi:D-aminopeptidase
MHRVALIVLLVLLLVSFPVFADENTQPHVRDLGIAPGVFQPGPLNAITDVAGVRVGHFTLIEGDGIRTGATGIVPHGGNIFQEKVPAAIVVGNGFGKLIGSTQVNELGQLETPILLTNTLNVWEAATALAEWTLSQAGNEEVRSVNPVVGETNDGYLNDIRARHLRREHFLAALAAAKAGPVEEGSVGAGTGTVAFGFKGGIGTSSRQLPAKAGGYTVGVLVQSNYDGNLTIDGVPVGKDLSRQISSPPAGQGDGSCMMVVATDAPLDARQLRRLAQRALAGMARTGASFSHGSGDYVIAFSTAREGGVAFEEEKLSPLFQAVAEATEEAIYNSLLRATTVHGRNGHVAEALPIDELKLILKRYGRGD